MAEPVWLPLQPGYLPWDLVQRPQWMCWKPESRADGKWSKPPRNPRTGRYGDKTAPGDWGTVYEAIEGMHRYGLAGVGYCVTVDDPFAFADLDRCRDPESGAIDPWAQAIIAELSTWAELSPSGTGIRLIAGGSLPPGGRRRQGVELYDGGAFLTISGHHVAGTPWTVHERSAELAAIHARLFPLAPAMAKPRVPVPAGRSATADIVLRKARAARNSAKFEALYAGQCSGYESASDADMALCGMLSYWSNQDPNIIDALFRTSGLYRDKWDEPHHAGGLTYGQMTVLKALGRR